MWDSATSRGRTLEDTRTSDCPYHFLQCALRNWTSREMSLPLQKKHSSFSNASNLSLHHRMQYLHWYCNVHTARKVCFAVQKLQCLGFFRLHLEAVYFFTGIVKRSNAKQNGCVGKPWWEPRRGRRRSADVSSVGSSRYFRV